MKLKLPFRLPRLELYRTQFSRTKTDPRAVQLRLLRQIMKKNKNTVYGKKYSFASLQTYEDFASQVPQITYDDILPLVTRMADGEKNVLVADKVVFFATTSGTTSAPKLLPVTSTRKKNLQKEAVLWTFYTFRNNPKALKGKLLYLAGPPDEGVTSGGIPKGSISGYTATLTPPFARSKLAVDFSVYNEMNFEKKLHLLACQALVASLSQIGFATPIEIVRFFEYLQDNREKLIVEVLRSHPRKARRLALLPDFRPHTIWPGLVQVNCIMGPAQQPYLETVKSYFDKPVVFRDPGIYASEARLSLGICKEPTFGVLLLHQVFYECIDVQTKKIVLAHEVELNKEYALCITTKEGLYRYLMGDVVRIVGFKKKLPLVEFVSRENFLNIVGELCSEQVLIEVVEQAKKEFGYSFAFYTFLPYTLEKSSLPSYQLLVEGEVDHSFFDRVEELLCSQSLDYGQMRNEFGRLGPLRGGVVSKESYLAFEESRRGQPKPLRIGKEVLRDHFEIVDSYVSLK